MLSDLILYRRTISHFTVASNAAAQANYLHLSDSDEPGLRTFYIMNCHGNWLVVSGSERCYLDVNAL